LWKCPSCGRQFPKKNQRHSCTSYSIDDHFRDRPISLEETFNFLIAQIRKRCGPLRVDSVKTAINLTNRYHFAMVYVRKSMLNLEFVLGRVLDDQRVVRTQKLGTRHVHVVRLCQPEDVDTQLLSWLQEAYALAT
ncbi:MAG: DUF5655 domain-containing protein, partial [Dehalococcoidia bacterium]